MVESATKGEMGEAKGSEETGWSKSWDKARWVSAGGGRRSSG